MSLGYIACFVNIVHSIFVESTTGYPKNITKKRSWPFRKTIMVSIVVSATNNLVLRRTFCLGYVIYLNVLGLK